MSAMFYYHNPLSFAGGATRLPSLELPFSPAQPCESSSEKVAPTDRFREKFPKLVRRRRHDLPHVLRHARRGLSQKEAAQEQDHI